MLPDASPREWVWTLCMVPGFIASLYNVWGSYRDIRLHWNDGYRAMGWVGLVKTSAVLLMAVLILAIGAIAMTTPEPARPEGDDPSDVIAGCLVALDMLVLVLAAALAAERAYVVPHIHVRSPRLP